MGKKKIGIISIVSLSLFITIKLMPAIVPNHFSENKDIRNDSICSETDEWIYKKEPENTVSQSYNISHDEIKNYIGGERKLTGTEEEIVVDIHRSVSKKVNNEFQLICTIYLEVVQDRHSNAYVEILAARVPNISLVGPYVNTQIKSSAFETEVTGKRGVRVYGRGTAEYIIPPELAASFPFPGEVTGDGQASMRKQAYLVKGGY